MSCPDKASKRKLPFLCEYINGFLLKIVCVVVIATEDVTINASIIK